MRKKPSTLFALAAFGLFLASPYAAMAGPEQAGTGKAAGQISVSSSVLVPVRGGHGGSGHGGFGGGFGGGAGIGGGGAFAAGPGRSFTGAGASRPGMGAVYAGRGQWSGSWARGRHRHHRRVRFFGPGFGDWGYDDWTWTGYGAGSCYWNCRSAGHGPAYCRAHAWNFCG